MSHIFFLWAHLKILISSNTKNSPFVREGEIWWCSIGKNVGFEADGKGDSFCRPVIILKKLSHGTFIGVPMTTKSKKETWYVTFAHKNKVVTANLSQIRMFDNRRLLVKMGELIQADIKSIKDGLRQLLQLE